MASILIAEDTADLRTLLRRFLQSAGHTVLEAADGRAALRLAAENSIDLLVCDMFMPEMDGIQTIKEFGQGLPGVPVIATSGGAYGGVDVLSMASHLGASRVLPKPFTRAALLSIVNELLAARVV